VCAPCETDKVGFGVKETNEDVLSGAVNNEGLLIILHTVGAIILIDFTITLISNNYNDQYHQNPLIVEPQTSTRKKPHPLFAQAVHRFVIVGFYYSVVVLSWLV